VKKISFGLLELEMADLERFLRKTSLGPFGVNLIFSPDFKKTSFTALCKKIELIQAITRKSKKLIIFYIFFSSNISISIKQ
jgi:hypothetical protein